MLAYPVRLVPTAAGGVQAVFPDLPQAIAEGRDEDDAMVRAKSVLERCLGDMAARGTPPPPPSDICGAPTIVTDRFSRAEPQQGA
jgi:antitoxin HicB